MSTMRIEEIKIKNFRQYENVKIEFPEIYENDINVLIGKNGAGKTTLLNAINWCLYGEEPHIFSGQEGLPIINTTKIGSDDLEVKVEIKISISETENYIYSRHMNFDKLEHSSQLNIFRKMNGSSDIIEPEYNEMYVNKFVNKLIREFYFFDV